MFVFLQLWLPVLVSAVAVVIAMSILHMVGWHKSDHPKLANETAVMDALRALNVPPGEYLAPTPADSAEMRSPEFDERMKRGPVFLLSMFPAGGMNMGRSMGLWFLYCIVVNGIAGHIAQRAGIVHGDARGIHHTVGLSAFLGYAAALWQMSVWYSRPWLNTLKLTIDGVIYAVITALIFAWLWP